MDNSILQDIREICDIDKEDDSFDGQLIPLINTYLNRAYTLGVGTKGFSITGPNEKWSDFITNGLEYYEPIKNYIGLRVKLIFDPPESSALQTALKEEMREIEWGLNSTAEGAFD